MTTSWDLDKKNDVDYVKNEYTKFHVGITRLRVTGDAPHMRWAHWHPASNRFLNCSGRDCPVCEIRKIQKENGEKQTYGTARRFSINVYNRETGKNEILEHGVTLFEEIKDAKQTLADKGIALKAVDIKVKRRGTDKDDTSYRVDIGDDDAIPEKNLQPIYDLMEINKPHTAEQILRILNGEKWEVVFYNAEVKDDSEASNDEEVTLK